MRYLLFLFFIVPATCFAFQVQQRPLDNDSRRQRPLTNKEVSVDGEKPPITDYLVISQSRDTTHVDTTLNMIKDYRFNYLRKDNFELMPFQNIGQPYNKLVERYDMEQLIPSMGAVARHDNYYEVEDVYDYHVPTPLTDLYFKTAINQGQQLEALFTSNISPQFNFSISYKGMRSAGEYVNTLTSTGNFKFTSSYRTKGDRYRLRLHTTFQDLFNEENAGLDPDALEGFLSQNEDLDDRGRLEPNIDDAQSLLDGKRFYLDHDYLLLESKDSVGGYRLRIHNTLSFEDKFYRYEEESASPTFFGESYRSSNLNTKTNFEIGSIEVGASIDHKTIGFLKASIQRQDYTYGYNRLVLQNDSIVDDRLNGEVYQLKSQYLKKLGPVTFAANGGLNFAGELTGQFLKAVASLNLGASRIEAAASINSRAPNFNTQLHQSDYVEYNWREYFSNVETQQLNLSLKSSKLLDFSIELNTIQDYVYFEERLVVDASNNITGYRAVPVQTDEELIYFKIKAEKEFEFLKYFGSYHTLLYQHVDQQSSILNVPSFITRNTFYYRDRWFDQAMQVQTGITVKYFDNYFMDAYDPILGEFYSQQSTQLGSFPLVDLFFNAKIQQTRIFFKVENLTSLMLEPEYFSAPREPYRDFSLRFGLVWNFFL